MNLRSAGKAEMSCKQLVELVTEYLEGTLSTTERARFEAHVTECQGCAQYLDQMRLTLRLTGRLKEESLDPDTRELLLDTFREWNSDR